MGRTLGTNKKACWHSSVPNDLPFHVGLVYCFPYLKVREGNERLNSGFRLKKLNHLKCHYSISSNFGSEVRAHVPRL